MGGEFPDARGSPAYVSSPTAKRGGVTPNLLPTIEKAQPMNPRVADLLARIQALEEELAKELEDGLTLRGFSLKDKVVAFEREVIERHRTLRLGLVRYLTRSSLPNYISSPVIYSLAIPVMLLDGWVSLYQTICFRAYGVPQVRRSDYVVFDRHHLAYLNRIEALNCAYCGYANGVIAYAREIASRTEQYWCPIKHALRIRDPHQRYLKFLEYGDAEGYRAHLAEYRRKIREG